MVVVTVDGGGVLCVTAGAEGFTPSVACVVATPTVDEATEGSAATGKVTTAVPVARSEVDGALGALAAAT